VGLPPLNPGVRNPLPWLVEVMDVKTETNFFEQKVTEYQTRGSLTVGSDEDF
jgi:ribonucleoside-diphosphate reductase beta chain